MRIAMLLLLVACGADRDPRWKPAGNTSPRHGGTLHLASKDAVSTLDPTYAYEDISTYVTQPLFATLVTYAPASTELVADLAEHWELDTAGTTYTFTLRDHLVYSDGSALTAADLKYSLERALRTPDSPFGPFLVDIDGAQAVLDGKATDCAGITAPSPRELRIQLTHRAPAFLYVLTMKFTTPQRADHVAGARRAPLASGPFMLATWDEGSELVLARNPHYYRAGEPYLDAITMRENIPRDTQFLMFETGELDAAERLAAPDYLWIVDQPAWRPYLHTAPLLQVFAERMNVTVKPFDDVRVRQALNYALDKQHSVTLLNNAAVPSHGMLPPGMIGRDDSIAPYPHDPVKARALLAAAGYPDGFDVEYTLPADEQGERLAASLAGDLAEVGVRVHIHLESFATFASTVGNADGPAFSMTSWAGDFPDPTNFLDVRFHSRSIADTNAQNDTRYRNPALDALLDQARGELDPAARAALYRRAERIIYDDAPWIFDYHPVTTEVTQPYVRGFELHPIWVRDYTRAWLDLDAAGERVRR